MKNKVILRDGVFVHEADALCRELEQAGVPFELCQVSKDGAGFVFGTPLDADAYENRIVTAKGIESRLPVGLLARGAGLLCCYMSRLRLLFVPRL